MSTLVSLIVPSRRPAQLKGFLDSIENTTINFNKVEVLVKIDDDRQDLFREILEGIKSRPFRIKIITSPRLGGQFTLWVAYEEMLDQVESSTYFVAMLTDEARFETYGWDEKLEKYVGFFADNVFRLRISQSRYVNNVDLLSCAYLPECFAIFTKKWLEIVEGFGDSYAPDTHHQMIAFHLASGKSGITSSYHEDAIFRDIPLHDISVGGFDWGLDVPNDQSKAHELRMIWEWHRLIGYSAQKQFSYYARRIRAYIWAYENNIEYFRIEGNYKKVQLIDINGHVIKYFTGNVRPYKLLLKNYDAHIFLYKKKLIISTYYIFIYLNIDIIKIYKYIIQKIIKIYKFVKNFLPSYFLISITNKISNYDFLESFPQGRDKKRFWFNFLYKKTGYITADQQLIESEYIKVKEMRRIRRERLWSIK